MNSIQLPRYGKGELLFLRDKELSYFPSVILIVSSYRGTYEYEYQFLVDDKLDTKTAEWVHFYYRPEGEQNEIQSR